MCGTYVYMYRCWLFLLLLCSNTERPYGGNFFGLMVCGHSPLWRGEWGGATMKLLIYVWGDQEGEKGDVSAQIAFPFALFISFQPQTLRWCPSSPAVLSGNVLTHTAVLPNATGNSAFLNLVKLIVMINHHHTRSIYSVYMHVLHMCNIICTYDIYYAH